MQSYRQTLDELFNIMTLCLPIDRLQRTQFVAHFDAAGRLGITNPASMSGNSSPFSDIYNGPMQMIGGAPSAPDYNWFQLYKSNGQPFALIDVSQFQVPTFNMQCDFDMTFAREQFAKYYETQEKARAILARQQQDALDKQTTSSPNEYFNNINKPKPVREISTAGLFPEINYAEFKIAPNIPNIGKASLWE